MGERVPTCVWRYSTALLLALDGRLGEPDDAYVNGSQVWIADNGPGDATLEWRLHPIAGFTRPGGTTTHELLADVVFSLRSGEDAPLQLWDGLEAFPAFADEVEPAPLAACVTDVLGLAPDAYGIVDHTPIGDAWELSAGKVSVIEMLLEQLRA